MIGAELAFELLKNTFGYYTPTPDLDWKDYDCVIAFEFGSHAGPGSANQRIRLVADRYSRSAAGAPVIMSWAVAQEHSQYDVEPACVAPIEVDSWDVLKVAKTYMRRQGLSRPLLVGFYCEVGRIAMQARSSGIGLSPRIPRGLPDRFDHQAPELWARSLPYWIMYELVTAGLLKIARRL